MPKIADLKRADGIWVDHHGTHPAVVLVEGASAATVICGTTKRKSDPDEVCIRDNSPAAVALGLNQPTYFYPRKVAVITSDAQVKSVRKRCPPNVFFQLERLALIAAQQGSPQSVPAKALAPVPSSQPFASDAVAEPMPAVLSSEKK